MYCEYFGNHSESLTPLIDLFLGREEKRQCLISNFTMVSNSVWQALAACKY